MRSENAPYTVIDSDNYKASGIDAFFFPGGEPHIKLPAELPKRILLFLKLRTWNDVGLAACLMDALENAPEELDVRSFIPYFPGGRQDRTDGRTPMTLGLTALLLHSFPVYLFDPHSLETTVVLEQYRELLLGQDPDTDALMPFDLAPDLPDYVGVIAPDAGAKERALDLLGHLNCIYPNTARTLIQCEKTRDFASGILTSYKLPGELKPGRYLIVDDICDGGATFNALAQEFWLAALLVSHSDDFALDLWVSHGIFSRGLENIRGISQIYTTDSFCRRPNEPRLRVLPLAPLFDWIME